MHDETVEGDRVVERGLLSVPDEVWAVAVRRAEVIGPLAAAGVVGAAAADAAAEELGLSRRQVYTLLGRWRAGEGVVSDLVPGASSGGRGGRRLPEAVEAVIQEVLGRSYLSRQRRSIASVHREVARVCRLRGLAVPSRGAVARRIADLDPVMARRARAGPDAARALEPAGGHVPPVRSVLEQVQIDHTVVDVIVVDARHRLPIGRPYVTVGIDVFSRCIVGMVLTLEAPSALSVGLCLGHMVTDKRPWLERLGVEAAWPMAGKPGQLYVDNASEFHSEALRRGCEQHGIELAYRPAGQPHYGGVVERVIGTLMGMVHELPGTTFSDPGERGGYDSQARAVLTLGELERWMALAVAGYHGRVHTTTGQTPAAAWAAGTAGGPPATVGDEAAFLIDFLPVIRRSLTRTGFVIDHVRYFSDALKPWIARRDHLSAFLIRRDPRDVSRVWVLEPEGKYYLEVPYRTLAHPAVTLWEQRRALARLRELGHEKVDEASLFRMIGQMRDIVAMAQKATRKTRREADRRRHLTAKPPPAALVPPSVDTTGPAGKLPPASPFDEIEEW